MRHSNNLEALFYHFQEINQKRKDGITLVYTRKIGSTWILEEFLRPKIALSNLFRQGRHL